MKTNAITFNNDFTTAYVTPAFMKKARVYGTPEYKMLTEFRKENEGMPIAVRKARTSSVSLSYENMEAYIQSKPNADELMVEYKRVRAESVVKQNRHQHVVKWFKAVFPNYKESEVLQKEENETTIIPFSEATANNDDADVA